MFDSLPECVRTTFKDNAGLELFMKLRTHYTIAVLVKTLGDTDTFGTESMKRGLKWIAENPSAIDDMVVLDCQVAGWLNSWTHMIDVAGQCAGGDAAAAAGKWSSNMSKLTDDLAEKSHPATIETAPGGGDAASVMVQTAGKTVETTFIAALKEESASEAPLVAADANTAGPDPDGFTSFESAVHNFFRDSHLVTGWPQLLPDVVAHASADGGDATKKDDEKEKADDPSSDVPMLHPFPFKPDETLSPLAYQKLVAWLEFWLVSSSTKLDRGCPASCFFFFDVGYQCCDVLAIR